MNSVPAKMSQYVRQLKEQWEATKTYVKDSALQYRNAMKKKDPAKFNKLREFQLGDEVTLFQSTGSKKEDKITGLQGGPHRVMEVHPTGNEYTIKKVGSRNKKDCKKVHVNHIRALRRFDSTMGETSLGHVSKTAAKQHAKTDDVVEIVGERGGGGSNQKHCLVEWEGYTEHSWEPAENLGCPEKIREWVGLSSRQRNARLKVQQSKEGGHCSHIGDYARRRNARIECNGGHDSG